MNLVPRSPADRMIVMRHMLALSREKSMVCGSAHG
jgi:hypothetical protein